MNNLKYRLAQLVSAVQPSRQPTGRRVLMYHSVGLADQKSHDIYVISRDKFAKHIEYLASQNSNTASHVVSLSSPEPNGVSITFDDGYQDTLTIAAKILCSHNFPFSVFVTAKNVDQRDSRYLDRTQLVELSRLPNVTIGSHGFSHLRLADLTRQQIREELNQSKKFLEDLIGKSVDSLSYPHGSYSSEVIEIAAETGFNFATTSDWGIYAVGSNPLQIPRIDVWSQDGEATLRHKISGKWDWIRRFL